MKNNVDLLYPLPKANLIRRYKTTFDSLFTGNSATLWTIPMSGGYSFLKFIFSEPELLHEISSSTDFEHVFLFFDFDSLPELDSLNFHKHLLYQISTLILESNIVCTEKLINQLERSKNLINSTDPYIMFQQTKKLLEIAFLESNLRITFIIHDYLLDSWSEAWGRNLYKLWTIHRKHPDNRVSFLFITKPYDNPETLTSFLKPLRIAYYEHIAYFPLFNDVEIEYTLSRQSQLYNIELTSNQIIYFKNLFGGFLGFYVPALQKLGTLKNLKYPDLEKISLSDQSLLFYARVIVNSLPISIQSELITICKLNRPQVHPLLNNLGLQHIPICIKHYINNLFLKDTKILQQYTSSKILLKNTLTGTEQVVLTLLIENQNKVISKTEIADKIWNESSDNYSDWALDKLISRLRSKISTTTNPNPLITIRGKGYQLTV